MLRLLATSAFLSLATTAQADLSSLDFSGLEAREMPAARSPEMRAQEDLPVEARGTEELINRAAEAATSAHDKASRLTEREFIDEIQTWLPISVTETETITEIRKEPVAITFLTTLTGEDATGYDSVIARISHQTLACNMLLFQMVLNSGTNLMFRFQDIDGNSLGTTLFAPDTCAR